MRGSVTRIVSATLLLVGTSIGGAAHVMATPTISPCTAVESDIDGNSTMDLKVRGKGGNQTLTIEDNPSSGTTVSLDCDGDGLFTNLALGELDVAAMSEFEVIDVALGKNRDTMTYEVAGANLNDDNRSLAVDLGGASNAFTVTTNGLTIDNNSNFLIDYTGGSGNDAVNITLQNIFDSTVKLTGSLGGGADTLLDIDDNFLAPSQVTVANGNGDMSNASVDIDFDLGTGSNQFRVGVEGDIDLGDAGASVVDVNVLGSPYEGDVDIVTTDVTNSSIDSASALTLTAVLQAGNDTFTGLHPESFRFENDDDDIAGGYVEYNVFGGDGDDILSVTRSGTAGSTQLDGTLNIGLRGQSGADTIGVDFGGTGFFNTSNGGAIAPRGLKLRADGGAGIDSIDADLSNNATATFAYDVILHGGQADDIMDFTFLNDGGTPTFGPDGQMIQDGGGGTNACTSSVTSGDFRQRNCPPPPP